MIKFGASMGFIPFFDFWIYKNKLQENNVLTLGLTSLDIIDNKSRFTKVFSCILEKTFHAQIKWQWPFHVLIEFIFGKCLHLSKVAIYVYGKLSTRRLSSSK